MKKSKWTQQRDDYFVNVFKEKFSDWKKKDKGNTQGEFARQICEIRKKKTGEKCPVTNSYVSEWLRGKWFPEQYLPEIAEVLGVKDEDFFFQTDEEKYKYSSDYINGIGKANIDFAKQRGLNIDLIDALSGIIDFNGLFPVYLPIPDRDDCLLPNKRSHGDSAPIQENQFMQIEREGKTITFHKCDLMYLKEVQDQVVAFVEFLFYKRSKEMSKEAYQFNEDFRKIYSYMYDVKKFDSVEEFKEAWEKAVKENNGEETVIEHKNLDQTVLEICRKYDRFMPYAEGKPKKRKATQKDFDNFFGQVKTKTFTEDGVTYDAKDGDK